MSYVITVRAAVENVMLFSLYKFIYLFIISCDSTNRQKQYKEPPCKKETIFQ